MSTVQLFKQCVQWVTQIGIHAVLAMASKTHQKTIIFPKLFTVNHTLAQEPVQ